MTDFYFETPDQSICAWLLASEEKFKDNLALKIKNQTYTYGVLWAMAKKIAVLLKQSSEKRCLILSKRNLVAYVSLIATVLAGKAYVFLNAKDTPERLKKTILLADTYLLITDEACHGIAEQLNDILPQKLFHLSLSDAGVLNQMHHQNNLLSLQQEETYTAPQQVYAYVYLMFTSGSTGEPKGVPITHQNLYAFLSNII